MAVPSRPPKGLDRSNRSACRCRACSGGRARCRARSGAALGVWAGITDPITRSSRARAGRVRRRDRRQHDREGVRGEASAGGLPAIEIGVVMRKCSTAGAGSPSPCAIAASAAGPRRCRAARYLDRFRRYRAARRLRPFGQEGDVEPACEPIEKVARRHRLRVEQRRHERARPRSRRYGVEIAQKRSRNAAPSILAVTGGVGEAGRARPERRCRRCAASVPSPNISMRSQR